MFQTMRKSDPVGYRALYHFDVTIVHLEIFCNSSVSLVSICKLDSNLFFDEEWPGLHDLGMVL